MANNGGIVGDVNATTTTTQNPKSGADQKGNSWGFGNDWVVNVPVSQGAGLSIQGGAAGGASKWLLIGGAALLGLLLLRHKKG